MNTPAQKHLPDKCRVCGMPELRCNHHRSPANRPTYDQLTAQLAAAKELLDKAALWVENERLSEKIDAFLKGNGGKEGK